MELVLSWSMELGNTLRSENSVNISAVQEGSFEPQEAVRKELQFDEVLAHVKVCSSEVAPVVVYAQVNEDISEDFRYQNWGLESTVEAHITPIVTTL